MMDNVEGLGMNKLRMIPIVENHPETSLASGRERDIGIAYQVLHLGHLVLPKELAWLAIRKPLEPLKSCCVNVDEDSLYDRF